MTVRVDVVPADELYTWSVKVSGRGREGEASRGEHSGFTTRRGSTFLGRLISSEDLERSRPDHRPALTPRGEAQLTDWLEAGALSHAVVPGGGLGDAASAHDIVAAGEKLGTVILEV